MKPELREKIIVFNRERAAEREKAKDFTDFLSALPPELGKLLVANERCGKILHKHGFNGGAE